ncbi:DUF2280 domain-containing protein [Paraburkholderia caffeinilytica]|uniref:DUF2280 domain-containing protein n=1 Tax=Paraburkholderia caffeinilytica TaxID=1761016 RepID=UPI003DA158AE
MSNVSTLSNEQKVFVVKSLASGKGVIETVRAFIREYPDSPAPSHQMLERYNPTTITGSTLSPELKKLFEKIYEKAQNQLHLVPNAHASMRALRLEDMYNNALIQGDHKLALAILAEARKNSEPFMWDPDAGDDDEGEEP